MGNGFNLLAPVYDTLARWVFGKSLDKSQCHFFDKVVGAKRALVVGGGTGRFLPHYFAAHPESILDFVEKSPAMLSRAKSIQSAAMDVNFMATDFLLFDNTGPYDLVLMPYFLDMFSDDTLETISALTASLSGPHTQIIVTDFIQQTSPGWKSLLLKWMYLFFRLTCGIEADRLPNWQLAFARHGWNITEEATYCKGMIGTYILVKGAVT